jgi:wyosine [tRNA(Phe)-imidazoG37] synthetase (radical SAM superfamily)
MKNVILYGAGARAREGYNAVKAQGDIPLCFCDEDVLKQKSGCLGLPVLSLEQATTKYKDFLVYVTPLPPVKFDIISLLLDNGIGKENIINYEESVIKTSCRSLESNILIFDHEFHYCCGLGTLHNPPPNVRMTDNIKESVDRFLEYRRQLEDELKSNGGACAGCCEVKTGYFPKYYKIKSISFSPSYPCNLRCRYCDVVNETQKHLTSTVKQWLKDFKFDLLINELRHRNLLDENCTIELSAGEICINPRCDEILDAVKDFNVILFSNCTVYVDKISEICRQPHSFLLESLDAGTRETYAKIKGVDAWDKVIANVRHYADAGANIHLKYVVTNENVSNADLFGFVELCKEIKPQYVRLSCDIHSDFSNLPQTIIAFAIILGRVCIENGISVLVLDHFGKANDNFIKSQIFG